MRVIFKTAMLSMLLLFFVVGAQAQDVNNKRARAVAENFFKQKFKTDRAVSISSLDSRAIIRDTNDEATFFFIGAPAEKGFVIVSGDNISVPLIGYSDGEMPSSVDDIPDAMKSYLADIDAQIRYVREKGDDANRAPVDVSKVGNVVVNLKTASWGQGAPFNKLCFTASGKQAKTGCIATAFAIIMRHHKWPEKGTGTVYNPITGEKLELGHIYDWDNMPLKYDEYTSEQADEVATVMRDLGYAYGLSYGTGSTNGTENAYRMSRHFGYVDLSQQTGTANGSTQRFMVGDTQWEALLKQSLDESCPVPYVATNSGSGSDAKHIFVVDGYTDAGYYHFNWGWNGSCNGYFTLARLDPTSGDDYASKTDSHKAFFGLKPLKISKYTVSVSAGEGGVASVNGVESVTVDEGTEVQLKALPDDGYKFTEWVLSDKTVGNDSVCTVKVECDAQYMALFERVEDVGIEAVLGEGCGDEIYDLCGRRINKIKSAGVYIVNGKKVLVK